MKWSLSLAAALAACCLSGAEIYVDLEKGKDANPGSLDSPLRNFKTAAAKAQPGDTIKLIPSDKPLYLLLNLTNIKGTPEAPITVDGSFNVLTGSRQVLASEISEVSPGLFVLKGTQPWGEAQRIRFFMLFDKVINRMGQHSKYKGEPFKKVEDLKDNEWTLVDNKDLYFRLPEGKTVDNVSVEIPRLDSGVQVAGASANLVIKNLIARNFLNDGYNIHGNCKNIVFENVAAIYNGDDSASAHEECEVTVRNLVGINNGTGLCHIQNAVVNHENCYLEGADSRDIFMLNKKNIFTNVFVYSSNAAGVSDIGDKGEAEFTGCRLYSSTPKRMFRTRFGKSATAKDTKLENYFIEGEFPGAEIVTDDSVLSDVKAQKEKLFAIFGERLTNELAK